MVPRLEAFLTGDPGARNLARQYTEHKARSDDLATTIRVVLGYRYGVDLNTCCSQMVLGRRADGVEKRPEASAAPASGAAAPLQAARSEASPVPVSLLEAITPTDPHDPLSAPLYASARPPVLLVGCAAV